MVYLLGISGRKVFLDEYFHEERCLSFHARANVAEVNGILADIFGVEPKILRPQLLNSSSYSFGAVEVQYIQNGKLSARFLSEDSGLIDKIRLSIRSTV